MSTTVSAARRLYRRATRLLGWAVVVGTAYLVVMSGSAESLDFTWEPSPAQVVADDLIAEHECWTGTAPSPDVIPSRAVVDTGDGPHLAPSDVGFDIYINDAPGVLFAFCP